MHLHPNVVTLTLLCSHAYLKLHNCGLLLLGQLYQLTVLRLQASHQLPQIIYITTGR